MIEHPIASSHKLDAFLARIRNYLDVAAPALCPLFETMASETTFAREWLNDDLVRLAKDAAILEIGGGVFILSCQLAAEGFAVTAIEPTGVGFDQFKELGNIVLELATHMPTIAACKVEDFTSPTKFDFAFSLNVMEHVDLPGEAIARVSAVLKPGATHRFLCANYLFPYETHFNMPTFFSKQLTWRLMRQRIEGNTTLGDTLGVWKSLNWITVLKVRRFAAKDATLGLAFNRSTMVWMLERVLKDKEFAARRSPWMVSLIRTIVALRLHRLVAFMPAMLQPIMDVRLTKRA